MKLSRKMRKEADHKFVRRKLFLCLASFAWAGFLYWMWYFSNHVFFTLTSMVTFFQLIMINPCKIRSYLPGLTVSSRWVKTSTVVGYIIAFFLLVSEISNLERR